MTAKKIDEIEKIVSLFGDGVESPRSYKYSNVLRRKLRALVKKAYVKGIHVQGNCTGPCVCDPDNDFKDIFGFKP